LETHKNFLAFIYLGNLIRNLFYYKRFIIKNLLYLIFRIMKKIILTTFVLLSVLTGVYAQLSLQGSIPEFGQVLKDSSGTVNISINSAIAQTVSITGLNAPFSSGQNQLVFTTPKSNKSINAIFHPTSTGQFSDTIILTGSVWGSLEIIVTGQGIQPVINTQSNTMSFGLASIGSTYTQNFTISNTGTGTLIINSITPSGTEIQVSPSNFTITA
jgi:hypothetical protein